MQLTHHLCNLSWHILGHKAKHLLWFITDHGESAPKPDKINAKIKNFSFSSRLTSSISWHWCASEEKKFNILDVINLIYGLVMPMVYCSSSNMWMDARGPIKHKNMRRLVGIVKGAPLVTCATYAWSKVTSCCAWSQGTCVARSEVQGWMIVWCW